MGQNRVIACMDSTHKAVKGLTYDGDTKVFKSGFLFTLLVKDRNLQKGIPISFMICNSESQYVTIVVIEHIYTFAQFTNHNIKDI